MISKLYRFHGRTSVLTAYRRSKTVRGALMSLKYAPQTKPGNRYRAVVVVSRKVSKLAVTRNRIRRRLYELLRAHASELIGHDIVLSVYDARVAESDSNLLERQLTELLRKANLQPSDDSSDGRHDIVRPKEMTN